MKNPQARGVLEAGLLACLPVAAMAFGGTQSLVWAGVQFTIFILTAAAVWLVPEEFAALPWKWLAVLAVFLVMQAIVLQINGERAHGPIADFLIYPAAFALTAALAMAPSARARLCGLLITLGVAEAVYGLAQQMAGWQQILGIEKIYYRSQATGTYVNPNHFAGLLEMTLPLALASAAWNWDHADSPDEDGGYAAGIFFAALALLLAAGIFVSHSRMGMASATGGAAVAAGVWIVSARGHRRRIRLATVSGVLVAASLLALWIGAEPMVDRFRHVTIDYGSRISLWRETAALVVARPTFGAGWGAFPRLYPQVQATELEFAVEHAHNDYLELATEFGIPGALLLIILVAGVVARALAFAWRNPADRNSYYVLGAASGITALGFHSWADFNLRLPANALIFAALLGLAWVPASTAVPAPGGRQLAR